MTVTVIKECIIVRRSDQTQLNAAREFNKVILHLTAVSEGYMVSPGWLGYVLNEILKLIVPLTPHIPEFSGLTDVMMVYEKGARNLTILQSAKWRNRTQSVCFQSFIGRHFQKLSNIHNPMFFSCQFQKNGAWKSSVTPVQKSFH